MPSRKDKSGEDRDIAHPLNAQTREMFEKAIFEEYENTLEENDTEQVFFLFLNILFNGDKNEYTYSFGIYSRQKCNKYYRCC